MSYVRSFILVPVLLVAVVAFCLPSARPHSIRPPRSQKTSEIEYEIEYEIVYLPLLPINRPMLRLAALYYDSETTGEPDEAFRLWNVSNQPATLTGYSVGDGSRTVTFPSGILAPGSSLWCTGNALNFAVSFGFSPGCEYGVDSDPSVPNLTGTALRFGNSGGQLTLLNPSGILVDTLVYENVDPGQTGWQGPAVQP